MNRNNITLGMVILFIIATVISMVLIYLNIANGVTLKILIAYLVFVFIVLIYILIIIFLNLKSLNLIQIRKRILKFSTIFILILVSKYLYYLISSDIQKSNFKDVLSTFGFSFGLTFFDLVIYKSSKEK